MWESIRHSHIGTARKMASNCMAKKKKKGRKITIIVSLFSIFVYVEFCLLLGFKQSFVNNVNNDAAKNGAPLRKKMRIWQFPT